MTQVELSKASELREKLVETATKLRELREMPADRRGETFERDARRNHSPLDAELSSPATTGLAPY
jgi:hypothetical protein